MITINRQSIQLHDPIVPAPFNVNEVTIEYSAELSVGSLSDTFTLISEGISFPDGAEIRNGDYGIIGTVSVRNISSDSNLGSEDSNSSPMMGKYENTFSFLQTGSISFNVEFKVEYSASLSNKDFYGDVLIKTSDGTELVRRNNQKISAYPHTVAVSNPEVAGLVGGSVYEDKSKYYIKLTFDRDKARGTKFKFYLPSDSPFIFSGDTSKIGTVTRASSALSVKRTSVTSSGGVYQGVNKSYKGGVTILDVGTDFIELQLQDELVSTQSLIVSLEPPLLQHRDGFVGLYNQNRANYKRDNVNKYTETPPTGNPSDKKYIEFIGENDEFRPIAPPSDPIPEKWRAKLTVRHLKEGTEEQLHEPVTRLYKEGETYQANPVNIQGYVMFRVEGQPSGPILKEGVTVTYYYKEAVKPKSTLTINYKDSSGRVIKDPLVVTKTEGESQAITKPIIRGYRYKSMTPNEATSHTFTATNAVYTLTYDTVAKTRVVVKYETNQGTQIKEPSVVEGLPGEPYNITVPQAIPNYEYESLTGNSSGVFPETGEVVLTLMYRKKEAGKVHVYHKDVETGEDVTEPIIITGNVGDGWVATKNTYKLYDFVRVDGLTNGIIGESNVEVTYWYRKVEVTPPPLPEPGGSSGCIDCKCKQVPHDENLCKNLQQLNDNTTRGASRVLRGAQLCDYPEIFSKILYNLWCLLKNIIAVICATLDSIDTIKKKTNEIIDKLNALCEAVQCLSEALKKTAEDNMRKALGNVKFSMKGSGTSQQGTYTKVSTQDDGSFTFSWNMTGSGGVGELGTGVVKGKVNASYTPNDDGSIQANIASVTVQSIAYTSHGNTPTGGTPADFILKDRKGTPIFSKNYDVATTWAETINKTIAINESRKLSPGSGSGDILVLKSEDLWVEVDTFGDLYASYQNNNQAIAPVPTCEVDCKPIAKL